MSLPTLEGEGMEARFMARTGTVGRVPFDSTGELDLSRPPSDGD